MFRRVLVVVILTGILIASTGCGGEVISSPEPTTTSPPTGVIVLADISDDPSETIEQFQPLADYLAVNLGELGIGTGEVKVAPDLETITEWMTTGEVDLYFDSLYPVMIVSDKSGAQPILRRWKGGVSEYHSVFFALAESGMTTLEDLKGQMVAFDEVFSTSGYMVPLAYLIEEDLHPVEKTDLSQAVAENEVGYIFSGEDTNTIQWVVSGLVAAGVVDSGTYEEDIPEETREGLVVLHRTEAVPRHVVLVSADVDEALREAVIELLLGLDKTEEGREILFVFEETTKFDEFPGGIDAALARMQELHDMVQGR